MSTTLQEKAVYFNDDELLVIENALESHRTNASQEVLDEMESVELKVGTALARPWALNKCAGGGRHE